MIASSGNKGDSVRSDCYVEISLQQRSENNVLLQSRVESMYGKSIRNLCHHILDFYEIKNAKVEFIDSGALPFVIAARMEAAIKKLIDTEKNFLLELLPQNRYKNCKRQK